IFDKKGINILAIDVREFSSMTDFFLIASGTVERHVLSLAQSVIDTLQKEGEKPFGTEGLSHGDWVVLDYGQIVVHLLENEMRDKYHLEGIWREGKIVQLKLEVSNV
ncbi:MAG: ribosome silencing factor, partial [Parachlamydiaceae bacterium]